MSWEAIGAVGEIVSAIAVVATLVYLSIQLRQTRTLMERAEKLALSQVHAQRAESRQTQELAIASTDHLAPIWAKVFGANDELDPSRLDDLSMEERVRFMQWNKYQITHFDNLMYQYELGLMNEESYEVHLATTLRAAKMWTDLGIPITPRLRRIYEGNSEGRA